MDTEKAGSWKRSLLWWETVQYIIDVSESLFHEICSWKQTFYSMWNSWLSLCCRSICKLMLLGTDLQTLRPCYHGNHRVKMTHISILQPQHWQITGEDCESDGYENMFLISTERNTDEEWRSSRIQLKHWKKRNKKLLFQIYLFEFKARYWMPLLVKCAIMPHE